MEREGGKRRQGQMVEDKRHPHHPFTPYIFQHNRARENMYCIRFWVKCDRLEMVTEYRPSVRVEQQEVTAVSANKLQIFESMYESQKLTKKNPAPREKNTKEHAIMDEQRVGKTTLFSTRTWKA